MTHNKSKYLPGVPNPGVFKKHLQKNPDPKTSYTLIWEVDSYTPVIEYNLWFRQYRARSGLGKPEWTKLTVPADHTTGFVFSKSYTIRGLKEKTIYEALLVSRNRYGWSKPSPILRFATEGAGKLIRFCKLRKICDYTSILDLKEEIITPIKVQEDNNIIQLDLSSGGSKYISNVIDECFFLLLLLALSLYKYL